MNIRPQDIPTYSIRNEFFCDKYDIVSERKLQLNVIGEVHSSRNLLSGKEVFIHMIPIKEEPLTSSNVQSDKEIQHHLNSSDGLLSIYESFHDG